MTSQSTSCPSPLLAHVRPVMYSLISAVHRPPLSVAPIGSNKHHDPFISRVMQVVCALHVIHAARTHPCVGFSLSLRRRAIWHRGSPGFMQFCKQNRVICFCRHLNKNDITFFAYSSYVGTTVHTLKSSTLIRDVSYGMPGIRLDTSLPLVVITATPLCFAFLSSFLPFMFISVIFLCDMMINSAVSRPILSSSTPQLFRNADTESILFVPSGRPSFFSTCICAALAFLHVLSSSSSSNTHTHKKRMQISLSRTPHYSINLELDLQVLSHTVFWAAHVH